MSFHNAGPQKRSNNILFGNTGGSSGPVVVPDVIWLSCVASALTAPINGKLPVIDKSGLYVYVNPAPGNNPMQLAGGNFQGTSILGQNGVSGGVAGAIVPRGLNNLFRFGFRAFASGFGATAGLIVFFDGGRAMVLSVDDTGVNVNAALDGVGFNIPGGVGWSAGGANIELFLQNSGNFLLTTPLGNQSGAIDFPAGLIDIYGMQAICTAGTVVTDSYVTNYFAYGPGP